MKYDQIKKRRKKYKVIIIIGLIILIILLLTVNIYHRLLGNVDQQSSQQKELLLQLASNYQTIIQKEIKKVQIDSLYMINNSIIERQDLKKQTVVKVSNIGADSAYGDRKSTRLNSSH